MPYFTKLTLIVCGAAFALSVASCDDEDEKDKQDAGSDGATPCKVVGKSRSCTCSDGKQGKRVCLGTKEYSECDCAAAKESCSTAGKQFECDCGDDITGTRVCLASGVFTSCNCSRDAARCCYDLGSCMASAALPEDQVTKLGQDSCAGDGELVCVPDSLVAGTVPALCHSINDSEGRCLPDCMASVAEQKALLPQDTCSEHHLCAPCIDPVKGYWTGVCDLSDDDPGQREPERLFDRCCMGKGYCVSPKTVSERVSEDLISFLGKDTCAADEDLLCAPAVFVDNPDFVPAVCRSIGNSEGRCLPPCVPEVADTPISLPQDTCDDGLVCAPCFEPMTGKQTAACTLPQDTGPSEPPVEFGRCCGGIGSCVPTELIPSEQQSLLGKDTCLSNEEALCAPDVFTDHAHYVPTSCRSIANSEGRCLPRCIPEVANALIDLPQDICPDLFACAPCYDPRSGELTGACTTPDDTGPKDAPSYFERCCDGIGSCVPDSVVSEANASYLQYLDEGSCTPDQGLLCAPDEMMDTESYVPASCLSINDTEGRCIPSCISEITSRRINFPTKGCPKHHVCAPCFDPVDGESTVACTFPSDPGPTKKPEVFSGCCQNAVDADGNPTYLGTCIPKEYLESNVAAALPGNLCSDPNLVCAPTNVAKGEKLVGCLADVYVDLSAFIAGLVIPTLPLAGACLPSCIVPSNLMSWIAQKSCADYELCVPCDNIDAIIPNGCDF